MSPEQRAALWKQRLLAAPINSREYRVAAGKYAEAVRAVPVAAKGSSGKDAHAIHLDKVRAGMESRRRYLQRARERRLLIREELCTDEAIEACVDQWLERLWQFKALCE